MSLPVSPKFPEIPEQKAVAGFRYALRDIDKRVDFLYKKIAAHSWFWKFVNWIGLGSESRAIRALTGQKNTIQETLKHIFNKPEEQEEPDEGITTLEGLTNEQRLLLENIEALTKQINEQKDEYEEALFFKNLFELGLSDDFPVETLNKGDRLLADREGLEFSLKQCDEVAENFVSKEYIQKLGTQSTTDEGRAVILRELKEVPDKFAVELPRCSITIGSKTFAPEIAPKFLPILAQEIREHAKTSISDESIVELLSLTMQQYLQPIISEVATNVLSPPWLAEYSPTGRSVSMKMQDEETMIVTAQDKKTFVNTANETETKEVTLQLDTHYNLKTKEVTFHQSYFIDGTKTEINKKFELRGG